MDTHKKASITATGEKLNNIRNKDIITDTTDYTTAIPYETNNNSGTLNGWRYTAESLLIHSNRPPPLNS